MQVGKMNWIGDSLTADGGLINTIIEQNVQFFE